MGRKRPKGFYAATCRSIKNGLATYFINNATNSSLKYLVFADVETFTIWAFSFNFHISTDLTKHKQSQTYVQHRPPVKAKYKPADILTTFGTGQA